MTARVLVVDDVPANVKLLEARLSAEYFDVVTAMSGSEALAICEKAECDIVLLDVMMPDMDGFEVCRRIKANRATHHIPVVMVTALDHPSDRVKGLDAGADDFLTKPVSDVALIARVRSLSRLKMMTDELRMRALTSREIGIQDPENQAMADAGRAGRVLIVDDRASSAERMSAALADQHTVDIESNPNEALFHAAEGEYDLMIVSLGAGELRRAAAVQPAPLARPHAQRADPGDLRRRGQRAHDPRARDRRERLSDAAGRQERAARPRQDPDPQEALHRAAARQRPAVDRDGDHRRAHRPLQPPLHGEPSWRAGGAGGGARQAAHRADARHRLFQVGQRQLRPRRRRRRAPRVRHPHQEVDPRHRSRLPARRRGIRHRDAGDRHGGRHHRRRAAAPAHRLASRSRSRRGRSTSRSRSRSGWRRSIPSTTTPPRSSSAPTRRSIAPSATAETASSPTRRNFHFTDDRPAFACRARAMRSLLTGRMFWCPAAASATQRPDHFNTRAADLWRKLSWAAPLQ